VGVCLRFRKARYSTQESKKNRKHAIFARTDHHGRPKPALLAYQRDNGKASNNHGPGSNRQIEPGEAALSGLGSTIRKAAVPHHPLEQQTLPVMHPSQSFFLAL
jgi:hypothetical protein